MITVLTILTILSVALNLIYLFFTVRYRPGERPDKCNCQDKVSILKPVKSLDDDLLDDLDSFFHLDYPNYELIFGMDSRDDPAFGILTDIIHRHPQIESSIIIAPMKNEGNPKVTTLIELARAARGHYLWVSDSNTRVHPLTLKWLLEEIESTGSVLVFSPILGCGGQSLGSMMENAYINLFVSGNILSSWKLLGYPVIVGKSMLFKRDTLEKMGGFERFHHFLAEDHIMGETFHRQGYRVSTNAVWITNINRHTGILSMIRRLSRWSIMRYQQKKLLYITEILTNPLFFAVLIMVFYHSYWQWVLLCLAVKIGIEAFNFFIVNRMDRFSRYHLILLPIIVCIKDCILVWVYVLPFFCRSVKWRGRRIRIGKGSRIYA